MDGLCHSKMLIVKVEERLRNYFRLKEMKQIPQVRGVCGPSSEPFARRESWERIGKLNEISQCTCTIISVVP